MNEDRTTVRNWCVMNVLPDDTFIDIGADIGEMSEAVWDLHRAKRIIAIDPETEVLREKLGNKIEIIEGLVADHGGVMVMHRNPENTALNSIYRRKDLKDTVEVMKPVMTLDFIVAQNNVEAPIVLKVDAEFAEHLIWKGMQKSLDKIRVMCMEFQYEAMEKLGIDGMKLLDEIKAQGFRVEFINNDNIEIRR